MAEGDDAAVGEKKKVYECEGTFRFTVDDANSRDKRGSWSSVFLIGGFGWRAHFTNYNGCVRVDFFLFLVGFTKCLSFIYPCVLGAGDIK